MISAKASVEQWDHWNYRDLGISREVSGCERKKNVKTPALARTSQSKQVLLESLRISLGLIAGGVDESRRDQVTECAGLPGLARRICQVVDPWCHCSPKECTFFPYKARGIWKVLQQVVCGIGGFIGPWKQPAATSSGYRSTPTRWHVARTRGLADLHPASMRKTKDPFRPF